MIANGSQRNGSDSLLGCKIFKGSDVISIFVSPAIARECSKHSKDLCLSQLNVELQKNSLQSPVVNFHSCLFLRVVKVNFQNTGIHSFPVLKKKCVCVYMYV